MAATRITRPAALPLRTNSRAGRPQGMRPALRVSFPAPPLSAPARMRTRQACRRSASDQWPGRRARRRTQTWSCRTCRCSRGPCTGPPRRPWPCHCRSRGGRTRPGARGRQSRRAGGRRRGTPRRSPCTCKQYVCLWGVERVQQGGQRGARQREAVEAGKRAGLQAE